MAEAVTHNALVHGAPTSAACKRNETGASWTSAARTIPEVHHDCGIMSTPSALPISLPLRFSNSFWTCPEYRKGVEALYARLQIGIDEDSSVLAFVSHRAEVEYRHAELLATPSPTPSFEAPLFHNAIREGRGNGSRSFSSYESSASRVFRTIESQTLQQQASVHGKVARSLERSILIPFQKWSDEHVERVRSSWAYIDANMQNVERLQSEVDRLRHNYESKCRQADEAEDDARFAGGELSSVPFETSQESDKNGQQIPSEEEVQAPDVKTVDAERLQRRETLRQQFGFRRPSETEEDKFKSLSPRSSSAELPATSGKGGELSSGGGLKRSGTISHALSNAFSKASEVPAFQNLRAAVGGLAEPRHLRLRRDAETAEQSYKSSVRQLDRARCSLEEILMEHFDLAERWESSRLLAVKRVLVAYNAAFSEMAPTIAASLQHTISLESLVDPRASLHHIIASAQTGSYHPHAEVFHPYYHDDPSSLAGAGTAGFGMDLVAFMRAETLAIEDGDINIGVRAGAGSHKGLPAIPIALAALLVTLERRYEDKDSWPVSEKEEEKSASLLLNEEKRKAWIYDVPLANSHACRDAIIYHLQGNSVPGADIGAGLDNKLKRFDGPTLAATVKLWALELVDSLVPKEFWDSVAATYQAAVDQERDSRVKPSKTVAEEESPELSSSQSPSTTEKGKSRAEGLDPVLEEKIRKGVLTDLGVILSQLPKIHLVCLDAIIGHLSRLVKTTPTEEIDSIFLNKLALSLSRVVLRPYVESGATVRSPIPILLVYDLVKYYDDLLPPIINAKAKDSEVLHAQRRTPLRKRTKPVDQRISRSRLSVQDTTLPTEGLEKLSVSSSHEKQPKVVTNDLPTAEREDSADDSVVTPIASRILPTDSGSSDRLVPSDIPQRQVASPSNHSEASAYDTPDEDTNKSSSAQDSSTADEDKPLSNVARISRQFGNSDGGSRGSKVRGPRQANQSTGSTTKSDK